MRSRDPKPIEPGMYPVILEAQAVADLLGFLVGAMDARTADEGRSAFSGKDGKTRVGESMFDKRLSLHSDPMHAELPAFPRTDEGVPAERITLIRDGVLERLTYPRFWAAERKQTPTPGPVNFIVERHAPPTPLPEMIKGMARGLLDLAILVRAARRPSHHRRDRAHSRRPVVGGGRRHPAPGPQPALQPERAGDARAVERRGDWPAVRRSPFMVPPLRVGAFTFTSISDAI